jgi:hypothetical protein
MVGRPDPYKVTVAVGLCMAVLVVLCMYLLHVLVDDLSSNTSVFVLEVLAFAGIWVFATFYVTQIVLRRHYPDIFR